VIEEGEDALAGFDAAHVRADLEDTTGDLHARREGERRPLLVLALHDEGVREVHPGGVDSNPDAVRRQDRSRHVLYAEGIHFAPLAADEGTHRRIFADRARHSQSPMALTRHRTDVIVTSVATRCSQVNKDDLMPRPENKAYLRLLRARHSGTPTLREFDRDLHRARHLETIARLDATAVRGF
jgi:hypothetical protein